jgi:hypothetical protein
MGMTYSSASSSRVPRPTRNPDLDFSGPRDTCLSIGEVGPAIERSGGDQLLRWTRRDLLWGRRDASGSVLLDPRHEPSSTGFDGGFQLPMSHDRDSVTTRRNRQGVRSRRWDGDCERESIGYLSVAGTSASTC